MRTFEYFIAEDVTHLVFGVDLLLKVYFELTLRVATADAIFEAVDHMDFLHSCEATGVDAHLRQLLQPLRYEYIVQLV